MAAEHHRHDGHDAQVQDHEHAHVIHYLVQGEQWTHLTATHAHQHNHAPLSHAHNPYQNEEKEHRQEAHIHDHQQPAESPA